MFDQIKNELRDGKTLIFYGGIRVGGYGLTFLIPIILAMKLSPEIFGIYSLGMMIIYFFNSTFILSSNTPFIIFGIDEIQKTQKISKTMTSRLILIVISTIIFLVITLLLGKQIIDFTKLTKIQFYFLVFVFAGKMLESFFGTLFFAFNQRILASMFQLSTAGFSVLYIIILYLFFEMTLENVFLMFLIAPMVSFCLFASKIKIKKIFPLSYDKHAFKKMTDYTKWTILGGSAMYLLNWGDNIILRRFSTMEEIGIYNLGYQFFKGTIMIMAIIKVYFLPFISQNIDNKEKITGYLLSKRIKLLFLGIILLGGLYLIMPYFVEILYKSRYEDSVLVFKILVIGALFAFYSIFYDPIFDSLERYKVTQSVIAVCVVFNLGLDYILVNRIGFMGAAIATSITYFLMAIIKEVYFRKYCRSIVT